MKPKKFLLFTKKTRKLFLNICFSERVFLGRLQLNVEKTLKNQIEDKKYSFGDFLPPVRNLAKEFAVSKNTVMKAIASLVVENYLSQEPKVGYKIKFQSFENTSAPRIATIIQGYSNEAITTFHKNVLDAFKKYSWEFNFEVDDIKIANRNNIDINQELILKNVSGAIFDSIDENLISLIQKSNIPILLIDSKVQDKDFDSVIQDNFNGGLLAANWINQKGYTDICWYGPTNLHYHALERFGGLQAGLTYSNAKLTSLIPFSKVGPPQEKDEDTLFRLLKSKQRPQVIVALWRDIALNVFQIIKSAKLKLGVDIELIGWSTEEDIMENYLQYFSNVSLPPTIIWSFKKMARLALEHFTFSRKGSLHTGSRKTIPVSIINNS